MSKRVEEIVADLGRTEQEIAAWDAKFAAGAEYNADDYAAYDALKKQYDKQMHEWEMASYELEIVEGEQ